MGYEFEVGNGVDEDLDITVNIGEGASNPRIRYDAGTSRLQYSNDGSTFEAFGVGSGTGAENVTWENPARWGPVRLWPDVSNTVPRWKWGADPEDEQDGKEFGQFEDFMRL